MTRAVRQTCENVANVGSMCHPPLVCAVDRAQVLAAQGGTCWVLSPPNDPAPDASNGLAHAKPGKSHGF